MKKLLYIVILFIIANSITACKDITVNRHEIQDVLFIRILGVDKADDDIKISIPIFGLRGGNPGGSAGAGQEDKKEDIVSETGQTVFEAIRKMHAYLMKDITLYHIQFLLIGEDALKDDLIKYIDLITRDNEPRLNVKVLAIKDSTAFEFIKDINTSDTIIFQKLKSVTQGYGALSISLEFKLMDLLNKIKFENCSIYIPCLEAVDNVKRVEKMEKTDNKEAGENKTIAKDPKLSGYAILKNNKLIGYIVDEMAMGLNFILDEVVSGIYVIEDKAGKKISMEVVNSKTDITPKIKDDNIEVNIKVIEECNLVEYLGNEIFDEEMLEKIKNDKKEVIRKIIVNVIEYAQKNKADFLEIGDIIYHKYPIEWEDKFKKNWENKYFPKVKFNVEAIVNINRVYKMMGPLEKKEK